MMKFYKYDGGVYRVNSNGQMCRAYFMDDEFDRYSSEDIISDDKLDELCECSDIDNLILSEIFLTFRNVYVNAFDDSEITIEIYNLDRTNSLAYIVISDDGVYVNRDFYYYDVLDISKIIDGLKASV